MRYAAIFTPGEDDKGGYWVSFPDIDGCFSQGESLAETFHFAQEALSGMIECMIDRGEHLPEPQRYEGDNVYWITLDAATELKLASLKKVNA